VYHNRTTENGTPMDIRTPWIVRATGLVSELSTEASPEEQHVVTAPFNNWDWAADGPVYS
jgi:hypothetical protein